MVGYNLKTLRNGLKEKFYSMCRYIKDNPDVVCIPLVVIVASLYFSGDLKFNPTYSEKIKLLKY